jgi:hypothetical protein
MSKFFFRVFAIQTNTQFRVFVVLAKHVNIEGIVCVLLAKFYF